MVYSPGNRDYGTVSPPGASDTESRLPRNLFIAVAVLGLVTYGLGFGPAINGNGATGWYIRFAALAGLVAAFGLLRKGRSLPTLSAVLAAAGFLDALSSTVLATDSGWAMAVIVMLNALQAAAAVAALLLGPEAQANATAADYEAYVDYYNQAVRNYYSQQTGTSPHDELQRGADGEASASAQAASRAQRTQRPSQYAAYSELDHDRSRGSAAQEQNSGGAASGRTAGLPSFEQSATNVDQPRRDRGEAAPPSLPT